MRKYSNEFNQLFSSLLKRKRGRPPKTKGEGPTPVAPYTKHQPMNPAGLTLTPTINNQIIINDPHNKAQVKTKQSNL